MRIVKASALALILSTSIGIGAAMAADAPKSGHVFWAHSGKHPICELLRAIFTLGHHKHHQNVVSVSY